MKMQRFTSAGTYTYAASPGTTSVRLRVQGAGGGGAGCQETGAGEVSVGWSGAGGGYAEKAMTADFDGATIVVGSAGAGGDAGNNAGVPGGDSSFTPLVGTPIVATGGIGGIGGWKGSVPYISSNVTGAAGSGGDINIRGGGSDIQINVDANSVVAPRGGASQHSRGASHIRATGTGKDGGVAGGYGGGGGGGINPENNAAPRAGGAGSRGFVLVEEYFD